MLLEFQIYKQKFWKWKQEWKKKIFSWVGISLKNNGQSFGMYEIKSTIHKGVYTLDLYAYTLVRTVHFVSVCWNKILCFEISKLNISYVHMMYAYV